MSLHVTNPNIAYSKILSVLNFISHVATTSPVPQQRKQVAYGGGYFYVAISFQRLFCCPSHNGNGTVKRKLDPLFLISPAQMYRNI